MKKSKLIRLNLGCGLNKMDEFINIDVEPSCKPDVICNFLTGKLPYKDNTVDEIVLFHTIEHINKKLHSHLLAEIWRVLKPTADLLVSYPEFLVCVENWKTNYHGQKTFWEATIFGRQLYSSDYHVCIIHTPDFIDFLKHSGFTSIKSNHEPLEHCNTIVSCKKGIKPPKYEDLIRSDMNNIKIIEV